MLISKSDASRIVIHHLCSIAQFDSDLFLQLLDACVLNCGRPFHLEIASRDFEAELKRLITKSDPKIIDKVKQLLKKWAEGEFKDNPQLDLIPSLYNKLKQEGCDFTSLSDPVSLILFIYYIIHFYIE